MYIDSVPNRSSPPAVLLRESYRDGGRVKKRTLANLSKLPTDAIQVLRRVLRGERLVNPEDAFTCVRSLPHGHIAAVLGTLKQLGLHTLIARNASRVRDLVLIVARVIDAQSLATARALRPTAPSPPWARCSGSAPSISMSSTQLARARRPSSSVWPSGTCGKTRWCSMTCLQLPGPTAPRVQPRRQAGHVADRLRSVVHGRLVRLRSRSSRADPKTGCQVEKIRTRFGLQRVVLVGDLLTAARRTWRAWTACAGSPL